MPSSPLRLFAAAARALGALAFPTLCLGCDRHLPALPPLPLCTACLRSLPRADPQEAVNRLADFPAGDRLGRATALWAYDSGGTVQRVQHRLKYGERPALGIALGRLLGQAVMEAGEAPHYDAVVPVPLAPTRRLERGYNQSAYLAVGVAAVLPGPPVVLGRTLTRTRTTRSQTTLSRAERWTNVEGAFGLIGDPDTLRGRRLLLVDDVLTTGATVTAAAQPLLAAGATVDLAAVALAA